MNIFAVSDNPVEAAQSLCDSHVIKMTLESAQILCSVFPKGEAPYNQTHLTHPVVRWSRETYGNYEWLYHHGAALAAEYTHRFSRTHASARVVEWCLENVSDSWFKERRWRSEFSQAMPDEFKVPGDSVAAYRKYYQSKIIGSSALQRYTNRNPPTWLIIPGRATQG